MNKPELAMEETRIRGLTAEDWPAVRLIYQDGIATGQATFETATPSWAEWDRNHLTTSRLVAISAGGVIGWAALSRVSSRAVYAGVAETSVYIAQEWRGKGVGQALLKTLVAEAESHGIWTLQASIFPENQASLKLHQACGFRVIGTRQRIAKLDGIWRDTVLLERRSNLVGTD